MTSRMHLLRALITSIFLYGCETWTVTAEMEKRINAFEMNCMRRLLQVHYTSHTSNVQIRELMERFIGKQKALLSIVKQRKLQWFGHLVRWKNSLANTILEGGTDGIRKRGRPPKVWADNIKDWTGRTWTQALRLAEDRQKWRKCVFDAINHVAPTA